MKKCCIKSCSLLLLMIAIVFACIYGYMHINNKQLDDSNSNVVLKNTLFGKSVQIEKNSTLDNKNIAYALLCVNFEARKTDEYSSFDGVDMRVHDYIILDVKTQKYDENSFFIYCEYKIKPYNIDAYIVGGGSFEEDWKMDSRFFSVEKVGDSYTIISEGTGPDEKMDLVEFK